MIARTDQKETSDINIYVLTNYTKFWNVQNITQSSMKLEVSLCTVQSQKEVKRQS